MADLDPTSTANDWLIADPARLEAWRGIARDCTRTADLLSPDADVVEQLTTWLLATHLRVKYTTDPGISGLTEINWHEVASGLLTGLESGGGNGGAT